MTEAVKSGGIWPASSVLDASASDSGQLPGDSNWWQSRCRGCRRGTKLGNIVSN